MIILGIDPGLATMGYGVLEKKGKDFICLDYGVVSTPKEDSLPVRLQKVEEGVKALIETYHPDEVGIEELFFTKNITNGIAVAEARGVILLTCLKMLGEKVYEYTPNQIKQAITGYGGAKKPQMQDMVQFYLGLKKRPTPDDAADALAIALTHGMTSQGTNQFKIK